MKLIGTGVVMGIVHVLTGPDHLSAIATLSANVGNFRSFWYGVRWGIGHSIGLILVGSTFIILSHQNGSESDTGGGDGGGSDEEEGDIIPSWVETMGETFVGFFMLALGLYSMYRVWKKVKHNRRMRGDDHNDDDDDDEADVFDEHHKGEVRHVITMHTMAFGDDDGVLVGSSMFPEKVHDDEIINVTELSSDGTTLRQEHQDPLLVKHSNVQGSSCADMGVAVMDIEGHSHGHDHPIGLLHRHDHLHYGATLDHQHDHMGDTSKVSGLSKQFLSVCIGIVHGVAGPGGVLGVIPAVQLHNIWLSSVYLASFCITSVLVMGCFAAIYGMCSSRISASSRVVEIRMEVFSSFLSIFVGSLWLVLIAVGKLHDVFP